MKCGRIPEDLFNEVKSMIEFAENYLKIEADGNLTMREFLICAALLVLALLIVAIVISIIKGIMTRTYQKKHSIFRNKKNKYKSRLGKKNIKY